MKMGFPTNMFTKPTNVILCAVCHDVIKEATSCFGCGHTFCKECLQTSLAVTKSCPTCRTFVVCTAPNFLAQAMINDMIVMCPKSNAASSNFEEHKAKKRKKENSPHMSFLYDSSSVRVDCAWKGKVSEVESHLKECHGVKDTDFVQSRAEIRKNVASDEFEKVMIQMEKEIELQFKVREAKIKKQCEEKLNEMRANMENERNHRHLLNLSRNWMKNRPALMSDFVVYLIFKEIKIDGKRPKLVSGLLCGIPGPKNTPWEGGFFPIKVGYNKGKSMSVKTPKGFSELADIKSPQVNHSLEKILLSFQQTLAGVNVNQTKEKIKWCAKEYSTETLANKAVEKQMIGMDEIVLRNDVRTISANLPDCEQ